MTIESQHPAGSVVPMKPQAADADTECRFVSRDEFRDLSISIKELIRWDDPQNSIRGLFDPETGTRYAIAEGNLFNN